MVKLEPKCQRYFDILALIKMTLHTSKVFLSYTAKYLFPPTVDRVNTNDQPWLAEAGFNVPEDHMANSWRCILRANVIKYL